MCGSRAGAPITKDPYGKYLLERGLPEATIKAWSLDPQVFYEDGAKGSVWDAMEDLDSVPLCEKARPVFLSFRLRGSLFLHLSSPRGGCRGGLSASCSVWLCGHPRNC